MNSKSDAPRYWFPAKRYGWGWGPPTTWQGWGVLLGYVALVSLTAVLFPPAIHPFVFISAMLSLTAALLLVMWKKGEPTRWRWGD